MQSAKVLLLESGSSRIVRDVSPRNAARMIERGQAECDFAGDLRVKPPDQRHEHPCRTRISSGGPLAAMGMSQIYTKSNERGRVDGFKRIFPEDRACFSQATNPGGWIIAVVSIAARAFMALAEAGGVYFH